MFITAAAPAVNAAQKEELEALVRNGNSSQKVALRCRLLLLAHQGVANQSIAQQLDVAAHDLGAARRLFQERNGGGNWNSEAETSGQGSDA